MIQVYDLIPSESQSDLYLRVELQRVIARVYVRPQSQTDFDWAYAERLRFRERILLNPDNYSIAWVPRDRSHGREIMAALVDINSVRDDSDIWQINPTERYDLCYFQHPPTFKDLDRIIQKIREYDDVARVMES